MENHITDNQVQKYCDIAKDIQQLMKKYATEEDYLKVLFNINVAAIEEIAETYTESEPKNIYDILVGALHTVQWDCRQNRGIEF